MERTRVAVIGLMLGAALAGPPISHADVIHLVNGNRLQVDGWKDAGDAIEFLSGGGIVRIGKQEIQKIDGKAMRGDFKMSSAPPGASAAPAPGPAAAKQLAELLKQGEGLLAQTVLSPVEKAGALRRLSDKWREVEVPDTLKDAHAKGQQAWQGLAEATASGEAASPEAKARVEKAKTDLQAVQDEVKKATGEPS
ncbi:MAG TPA: hypothetical protein VGW35_14225 [Methylomirabilota bacterium]|jgi:hypothetical protein|nr:hypothetical protein [Methylomirabilota bacterium]